jgi:hypothetical protein
MCTFGGTILIPISDYRGGAQRLVVNDEMVAKTDDPVYY